MRVQTESYNYTAPDGTTATVVANLPGQVTYYVPTGQYQGYYHYDKHSKQLVIANI